MATQKKRTGEQLNYFWNMCPKPFSWAKNKRKLFSDRKSKGSLLARAALRFIHCYLINLTHMKVIECHLWQETNDSSWNRFRHKILAALYCQCLNNLFFFARNRFFSQLFVKRFSVMFFRGSFLLIQPFNEWFLKENYFKDFFFLVLLRFPVILSWFTLIRFCEILMVDYASA